MTEHQQYGLLLYKYLDGTISAEEAAMLEQWLQMSPERRELLKELSDDEQLPMAIQEYHPDNRLDLESRIFDMIKGRIAMKPASVALYRRSWFRVVAAACLVLLLGLGSYFVFVWSTDTPPPVAGQQLISDVKAPETNRATITLADGSTVYLDNAGSGALAQQGNMRLVKLADGQIAYQAAEQHAEIALQYNTLTNPRGSKVIDITLADGSRVWLNAGTTFTYPVAFTGSERNVSVSGEAYFEVMPDNAKPFLVNIGNASVKVLGTHFNVMNYSGEPAIQTTLLEGSVQIIAGNREMLLEPGQQSNLEKNGSLSLTKNVDVELVTAWKNGLQSFRHADLKTLMRRLERWYDVDVVYEAEVPAYLSFTGEGIARNVSLRELLQVLENNELKFEIDAENRKVSVKKANR